MVVKCENEKCNLHFSISEKEESRKCPFCQTKYAGEYISPDDKKEDTSTKEDNNWGSKSNNSWSYNNKSKSKKKKKYKTEKKEDKSEKQSFKMWKS